MKSITIALKDLSRAFRSMFALAFMFGVPILMTLLFAFLFGGVGGSNSEFTVPKTTVQIVNLDQGSEFIPHLSSKINPLGHWVKCWSAFCKKTTFPT